MPAKQKTRISLMLSSDVLENIDQRADGANLSRSSFIENILRQYLHHDRAKAERNARDATLKYSIGMQRS
jgi:metal-responsive CopG/Arc/MetJ family transcriptional regulator